MSGFKEQQMPRYCFELQPVHRLQGLQGQVLDQLLGLRDQEQQP